jgi:Tol biopolymer transport system component/DNA-binding winged helix-turn-helix (wHTH) protein
LFTPYFIKLINAKPKIFRQKSLLLAKIRAKMFFTCKTIATDFLICQLCRFQSSVRTVEMSANLKLIYSEFNLNVANDSKRIIYVFDEYRLDAAHRMLYRGEIELALVPKAVETLLALIDKRGEIVSKDELIETIWTDTIVEESNLQHYLHVLRKTLGTRRDGKPFIETFRRRGYRFSSDVQIIEKPSNPNNGDFSENRDEDFYPQRKIYQNGKIPDRKERLVNAAFGGYFWLALAAGVFAGAFALTIFLYVRFQTANNVQAVSVRKEISITNLTSGNPIFGATISNDGRYFVYSETEGSVSHLWLQQTGQPTRLEIIPSAERSILGKTFSPSSEFVYFMSLEKGETEYALYRVPTLGGVVSKILTNIGSPVSFSPNGREMVFSRYTKETKEFTLVVADRDGGNERILLTRSNAEQLSISNAWSPDGKTVAFGAVTLASSGGEGNCLMSSVEIDTGVVKSLSAEKWDTCYRMVWTRDGEGLIFIGTRDGESYTTRRDQVFYLDAAMGESRRITSDGNRYQDWSLGITNENSIIAVPHNRLSQIWAMNADGDSRSAVQITKGVADGRSGIAPLPDDRVGYITRNGENLSLWTVNANGTNQKQVFNELPFIEELRATPDGRYFIFSARRDKYNHLYRLDADGTNLKQLTSGESYEIDSTVSPDSRWIFYNSNIFDGANWKSSLQKITIDGSASVRLTADGTKQFAPQISPDGKYIADVSADEKLMLMTDDGAVIKTLGIAESPILYVRWLANGEALTYPVYKNNIGNIWQQPISGGNLRPLTNFTNGEIFNHAFSSDGKKLYVSRGYQSRNAVLIKNFKVK